MIRSSLVALALLTVGSALGCADTAPAVDVHGLRLLADSDDYPTLTGYVVNLSEVPLQSADVAVSLYDADNQPLGSVMMQVRRVLPGDSARFERVLDRPATAARLRHVTAS